MSDILARMRQLGGTAADWAANDLVIGLGELAVEFLAPGVFKAKLGDGVKPYSALPYVLDSSAFASFVQKAGDTMTGVLTTPNVKLKAATYPLLTMEATGNGLDQKIWWMRGETTGEIALFAVNDAVNSILGTIKFYRDGSVGFKSPLPNANNTQGATTGWVQGATRGLTARASANVALAADVFTNGPTTAAFGNAGETWRIDAGAYFAKSGASGYFTMRLWSGSALMGGEATVFSPGGDMNTYCGVSHIETLGAPIQAVLQGKSYGTAGNLLAPSWITAQRVSTGAQALALEGDALEGDALELGANP